MQLVPRVDHIKTVVAGLGAAGEIYRRRLGGTGQFHGGAIASLIDIAGDFALILGIGDAVPTINYRVDYLRPAFGNEVRAQATVRRAGRSIGVVDIDVHDSEWRLIAVGRGCYGTQPG
jgi:uncharacterized protein (TIGR00369 family)